MYPSNGGIGTAGSGSPGPGRKLNRRPIFEAHAAPERADTIENRKGVSTVKFMIALCIAAIAAMGAPALAGDSLRGLAPADEYFGRFNLSILGVTNTIRDAGNRLDAGADPHAIVDGPLYFATDALRDWKQKYPTDPWLPKELLALENVYLRVPGDDGPRLAARTEAWLIADFPSSSYADQGRKQLADAAFATPVTSAPAYVAPAPSAWERFAALRAPLAPR
jgi:hypothetical protein